METLMMTAYFGPEVAQSAYSRLNPSARRRRAATQKRMVVPSKSWSMVMPQIEVDPAEGARRRKQEREGRTSALRCRDVLAGVVGIVGLLPVSIGLQHQS